MSTPNGRPNFDAFVGPLINGLFGIYEQEIEPRAGAPSPANVVRTASGHALGDGGGDKDTEALTDGVALAMPAGVTLRPCDGDGNGDDDGDNWLE